ncbi:MAG: RHS repeat protein [Phycisphaerales bacterium]|nr:RHS repeat protein [Phycisphaerales bacterium]
MRGWRPLASLLVCSLSFCGRLSANPGDCATKGDRNGDCRIAVDDFENLVACWSGPQTGAHPACVCFDFNNDTFVDMRDFASFQTAFTGDALLAGCDLTAGDYEPGTRAIPPSISGLEVKSAARVGPLKWMAPESLRGVYLFSGEVYTSGVDFRIPGRGFDFVWERKYRSRVGPDTAQGAGWDYCYNVRVEADGGDLVLHDGNTRADLYRAVQGPTGTTWCAAEFFREINQEVDGSYTCRLASRAAWRFHPLDGLPHEGKLSAIVDTNGNTMTFSYDVSGRLSTITDTLNRQITIAHNPAGRISSVTDFAGRQVQYAYYGASDPNGAEGDLKSVTSPAVTGTPNGNDFPSGKTTTYTYSRGFANVALNHNLLSITDAKGQTYLRNVYASTLDPNDPDFDRVTRRSLGEPNDIYDFVYEDETPGAANGYAVRRATVNDRNGHVDEYFYDKFNRCVLVRELTGQANPTQPTSSSSNRPTGKLRQGDPNAFVTRFEYNSDALTTRVIDPELNITEYFYESDLNLGASPRSSGNLRVCVYEPGPRGGDQPAIMTDFEYDSLLNGDTNRITRETDGRGASTLYEYDAAGNRTKTTHRISSIVEDFEYNTFGQLTGHTLPDNGSGHRRRDERVYYANGPQTGYLQSAIVDATGQALTTTYEYDTVGNIVRTIDPRGGDTLRIVNQLDQVVRVMSRAPDPNTPTRYETDTFYDENDNVLRVDVQNRDETGALQINTHFTTEYDYDILNRCVRVTEEVDAGHDIVTEYEYDSQSNRTLVRSGEATATRQPSNTVTTIYDERDLVFREIRAAGDPQQSTTQMDYDGNRNVVRREQGTENSPRVTTATYDGYDRAATTTDPTGNESSRHYDENGNTTCTRVDGELSDQPGGATNVRMFETAHVYDDMDRLTQTDVSFFDAATQSPIGNGVSTTTHVYTDNSDILSTTDDNGNTTTYVYDTVNRRQISTDAKNNTREWQYDDNSNVVRLTQTDKSDLGLPDEVFITDTEYDGLDRIRSEIDSSGNIRSYGYDSRDNEVVSVDALSHERRFVYDGLNRMTSEVTDLDGDGADGDGADIVTTKLFDDNSRVILEVDDNGNNTLFDYDALDRLESRTNADATGDTYAYDVHHNIVNEVQANGSIVIRGYDALDRLTSTTITPGPGVSSDTTFETYEYDGLSRLVSAADDDSVVTFEYDSMSNVIVETLQGDATTTIYDGVGNPLSCVYPSGQSVSYTYDSLNRLHSIDKGLATISTYLYTGSNRVSLQIFGNGVSGQYQYDGIQGVPNPAGDSGVRQVVGITHTAGPTVVDSRTFTWDSMFNKTERRDTRTGGPELRHAYAYDAAYRLTQGVEENAGGIPQRESNYQLDGVGNRLAITGFGGVVGPYAMDANSPPADFQVNQYTRTPRDRRTYDDNGNLSSTISGPRQVTFVYDAYDRLITANDSLTGNSTHYSYDALGRRIGLASAPGCCDVRYRYAGDRVVEELDPNNVTMASYVRGSRAAEIVCVERNGQVYYQHADDVGNVVALTDPNGDVIERYEYDDFGLSRITDRAGAPLANSLVDNVHRHHGQRLDLDNGLYFDGSDYYDASVGRYITRSSDGAGSGIGSSAYDLAGSNPWSGKPGARRADHRGHVTVLKAHDSGPPHCPGCGALFCRCTNSTRSAASDWRGHVTVLKAHGAAPDWHGHVTVLKARGAAGPLPCPSCGSKLCRGNCRDWEEPARRPCPHVTILKAPSAISGPPHCPGCGALLCRCTSASRSAADWDHHGHVTVLKAHDSGPPHCPGCGALLCRCTGSTRSAAPDGHGHVTVLKARSVAGPKKCGICGSTSCGGMCDDWEEPVGKPCPHVTILKIPAMLAGPPHCPGCGALLCRCNAISATSADGLAAFGDSSQASKRCNCARCRNRCIHGNYYPECTESHPMLPAANPISTR